jgi:hypothetical protein
MEGVLTAALRKCEGKHWIHLDGPIDFEWVETLNSLLDDNQALSLPNGETLKITQDTTILFETDSLQNLTPATVSRCGLLHLSQQQLLTPKQVLNKYLLKLPANVKDYLSEIEAKINCLMPLCVAQCPSHDPVWLVQTFIKHMDSFFQLYWFDYIQSNETDFEDPPQQQALKKCLKYLPPSEEDIVDQLQQVHKQLNPKQLQKQLFSKRIRPSD